MGIERGGKHKGPTCRLVLDLRGIPWAGDESKATAMLLQQPGVLAADVDAVARRAVVIHDARVELPLLWNWLVECRARNVGGQTH
ncbi:heavy-metal-associated domain-containing protein [Actinomadura luteofluorescens]|uniref:heavy-metal-associated domain-containing protein n=1 Tax=Actinomadura luteofluorescens TaxID=46163 RepID=UPI003D8E694A